MKRVLFVVSEDWYFVSHRFHLAIAALRAGYQVALLTRVSKHRPKLEGAGIQVIDWALERRSRNPLIEVRAIAGIVSALRSFQPDLIHAVALKPVLYAAFAARLAGLRSRVFALGGLGFLFASRRPTVSLIRPLVIFAFRFALAGAKTRVILQNPDDLKLLERVGVIDEQRARLIRGAGVNTQDFAPQPESPEPVLVVMPARMLWDKGVGEFVACARESRSRGSRTRFALVGDPDPHNPECVPEAQLKEWVAAGDVEWWGHREDMPRVFAEAHIVCLPSSYGEGLPKALLEAASCARPIVTYDAAGCREIVENGVNGVLVPFEDVLDLRRGIEKLASDSELRERMGAAGRAKVLRDFSEERVASETLRVWDEVLA